MNFYKFLLFFSLLFLLTSCHVGRFFYWNFADVGDYKKFQKIDIQHQAPKFEFVSSLSENQVNLPKFVKRYQKELTFEKALEKSGTVAFMIIKNDTVLYEKYFHNREQASIHPSFSVAKSITSMLLGIAIDAGKIKSVHEPITNYLPELENSKGFEKITIEHLLDMRSGIKFNEGYFNPFGNVAKFYYGRNIKKYIKKLKIAQEPDQEFEYRSINTQLLALIVEKAVGKSIVAYLEEKIWKPLGMEYEASWSIDSRKHQTIKAFCCLNARTRDFAKLGRLYLNKGKWNGSQIISEKWIEQSTKFDTTKNDFIYSYQWWHTRKYNAKKNYTKIPKLYIEQDFMVQQEDTKEKTTFFVSPYSDFYAKGLLGQYIYIHPQNNIIIVRLGKKHGGVSWGNLFKNIAKKN